MFYKRFTELNTCSVSCDNNENFEENTKSMERKGGEYQKRRSGHHRPQCQIEDWSGSVSLRNRQGLDLPRQASTKKQSESLGGLPWGAYLGKSVCLKGPASSWVHFTISRRGSGPFRVSISSELNSFFAHHVHRCS